MRRSAIPGALRWALTIFVIGLLLVVGLGVISARPRAALDTLQRTPGEAASVDEQPAVTASLSMPSSGYLAAPFPTATSAPILWPTPTATLLPPTATPEPTWTPAPLPTATTPPTLQLSGMRHYWQTWNNCGPATLAMNLSYYGSTLDQATVGAVIRRHPDDKNVDPEELAAYARSQGYLAEVRVGGSADLARAFLANGIPLLIETWLEEEPNDGLGHYRLLVGYDDAAQRWTVYDSYVSRNLISADPAQYRGIALDYAEIERLWRVYNYTYVLIYPPDRAETVAAILGASADPAVMWQERLVANRADVASNPDDSFAHFNLGSTLAELGDYAAAADAFDRARSIGLPWRMLWYQFGPFAAYTEMGRFQEVLDLGQATLNSAGSGIEEIHYWRGRAAAGLGDTATARAEWERVLALNPDFVPARDALATLP